MIKISTMSGKLAGLKALNTSPLQNPFCQARYAGKIGICGECYSNKMVRTFRQSANIAWHKNGEILSSHILHDSMIPVINCAFFRFSAHGELINENHLINLLNICHKNPYCTFALWTKRDTLVRHVIAEYGRPDNLILIYSETEINNIVPPPDDFDKSFCVMDYDNSEINCQNHCMQCLKCYTRNDIKIIVERMK